MTSCIFGLGYSVRFVSFKRATEDGHFYGYVVTHENIIRPSLDEGREE